MKWRSQLSKVKFALGYNPVIERNPGGRFIPNGHKAVFTLTADFELAWAARYDNRVANPYRHALQMAKQERRNIPRILDLCQRFNIPVTWATVGHLFLHACQLHEGKKHPEIGTVPAYHGEYWDFQGDDWFEYDPCTNVQEDPEWYAPDLIDLILESETQHEIGCHTFSHIDCRDGVCPSELFRSELIACQRLAEEQGLSLKSFVHPGHTIGNLDILVELGFTSFQSDPGNILGYPVKHSNGLWELKRTMDCYLRPEWSVEYHIYRYQTIIDRAIKNRALCNLWFHPSLDPVFVDEIFPELLAYIDQRREVIWPVTVGQYVDFLNQKTGSRQ